MTTIQLAISTTFTPPATCTSGYLTMMERLQWEIWLNYPSPVAGSTVTDCYPTPYMSSFLAAQQPSITAPLPAISPLVCPIGYTQILSSSNGYIACCPSNYLLANPTTSIITSRPAYGGTCYSDISTVVVTSYANSSSPPVTSTWSASTQPAQAFALVMEGYAPKISTTSRNTIISSSIPSQTSTPSTSTVTSTHVGEHISGGAIAGIVIGCIIGVLVICALVFVLFIRPRRRKSLSSAYHFSNKHDQPELPAYNICHEKQTNHNDVNDTVYSPPKPPPKNNIIEMPAAEGNATVHTKDGLNVTLSELEDTRGPPMTRSEMAS